jgi:hypothetical protein
MSLSARQTRALAAVADALLPCIDRPDDPGGLFA